MTDRRLIISSVLFALGVLLVFIGLSSALHFTLAGMFVSVAVIAALLYAGAVWFTPPPPRRSSSTPLPEAVIVFDRDCRIVSGPAVGQPLALQFPETVRADLEGRCAAALSGNSGRFSCAHNGIVRTFDALPVRTSDGTVIYGILVASQGASSALAVTA